MRFTHDDLREALNHKDWLDHLVSALTLEETKTEEGPATQASLHGLPNVVSKTVVLESEAMTRIRAAVALGLIPVNALMVGLPTSVDLAALRLREAMIGESAEANRLKLEESDADGPSTEQVHAPAYPHWVDDPACHDALCSYRAESGVPEASSEYQRLLADNIELRRQLANTSSLDQTPQNAENDTPGGSGEPGASVQ